MASGLDRRLNEGLLWPSESPPRRKLPIAFKWLAAAIIASAYPTHQLVDLIAAKDSRIASLVTLATNSTAINAKQVEHATRLAHKVKTFGLSIKETSLIVSTVMVLTGNLHQDMTPELILAVIATESGFDKTALGLNGATGLMQVTPASGYNTTTALAANLTHGISLIADYHSQLGSVDAALHAYNVGITAYRKGKRSPDYVSKVKIHTRFFADQG